MVKPLRNVFGLEDADNRLCHLLGYHRSGSFLEIKIYEEVGTDNIVHLQFEGVVYVDAPVFWKGACFDVATDTDCLALLRELHVHDELPGDTLVGQFQLWIARTVRSARVVRVVAIRAELTNEPSGRFE